MVVKLTKLVKSTLISFRIPQDPCIKIEAINIKVLASNGLHEAVQILAVVDVVCESVSTYSSILSRLRPTATTLEPSRMSFSAIPRPMPEVAPP